MAKDYSLNEVQVSMSPGERFEEYLQSRGMRQTQQRRALLELVFSRHEHFDADTLIEQLPAHGESNHVSRPTVYRTLNEFVDAGLLRRFSLAGRSVYEHDYGYPEHDHLYCEKCQRLIEFQSEELTRLRDQVAAENRFRISGHRLIITGRCESCSRTPRRTKRKQDRI
jgi:Fur family ferric uptake transcriptional regulator